MNVHGALVQVELIEPHHGTAAEVPVLVVGKMHVNLFAGEVLDDCLPGWPEVPVEGHEYLVVRLDQTVPHRLTVTREGGRIAGEIGRGRHELVGGDDCRHIRVFIQLGLSPVHGCIRGSPVERQHQKALSAAGEDVAGVVAIGRRAAIGALMGDAAGAEIIEIRGGAALVVVQSAVDVVVARGVSILDVVAIQDLEHIARLGELGRQAVIDDVAELYGENDVFLAGVIHDPLQGFLQDLRIVAVFVEEVLRVGNDGNAEALTTPSAPTAPKRGASLLGRTLVGRRCGVRRDGEESQQQQCRARHCAR